MKNDRIIKQKYFCEKFKLFLQIITEIRINYREA